MCVSPFLFLPFLVVSAFQVDRSEKLNSVEPIPKGTVNSFQFSPDQGWMAYQLDGELHARTRGGTQRRLSAAGQVLDAYRITSDSARVVYTARSTPGGPNELWSTDGNGPPVRLSGTMGSGGNVRDRTFDLSPDGRRVYYTADPVVDDVFQVYGVPSDGSSSPQALAFSRRILNSFQVSPDGTQLVVFGDLVTAGNVGLFLLPSDGSGTPTRLNPPGRQPYSPFEFSPDGRRLAFRANFNGRTELYTIPLDLSSSAVVINAPMAIGGEVISYDFTPNGQALAYAADTDADTQDELYLAPADASAPSLRLDAGVGSVILPLVSPDGARIVFQVGGSASGLYSVALAGGAPVPINGPQPILGLADYAITPDSRRVVYLDRSLNNRRELNSTPIDGSAPPVKLSGPLVSTGSIRSFRLTPNGRRVVFVGDPNVPGQSELFARLVDGSGTPSVLNPPLGTGGSVGFDFAFSGSGTVFFRADARLRFQSEVYSAPLAGGPASVVDGLLPRVAPQVGGFRLSRDEERIVYVEATGPTASGTFPGVPGGIPVENVGLRKVDLSSPGITVRLSGELGAPIAPTFGPWVDRVYFTGVRLASGFYSAPLDASAPPTQLAAGVYSPGHDGIRFSSTDRHVLIGAGHLGGFDYLASADASQPLSALGYSGEFTPDGSRVLFSNGEYDEQIGSFEYYLYTRPSDQSAPEFELTPPNVLREFQIAGSDSSSFFAVYTTTTNRLFRVHAPDAAFRDQLSTTGHDVAAFEVAPDGKRVLYFALGFGLFRADVFTLSPPVLIAGPVLLEGDTFLPLGSGPRITFTPDGARALYLASGQSGGRIELFSVPLDASSPPARLSGPFVAGGNVRTDAGGFVISPNGARVVYLADQDLDERFELYSAHPDGSAPAMKISGLLGADRDVELPVRVLPNSFGVVFRSDQDLDERLELWFASLDGRGSPRRVNGSLLPESDVLADFVIDRTGENVYYRADQEVDGRVELYRHPLSPPPHVMRR
jgi:Tol biopolymer transport system component